MKDNCLKSLPKNFGVAADGHKKKAFEDEHVLAVAPVQTDTEVQAQTEEKHEVFFKSK